MTPEKIIRAYKTVSPYVQKTPLIFAESLSRLTGVKVYLKCENLQKTGSFKVRGAFNKLISLKKKGVRAVIAASMGNHAQGVAYAASTLGISSKIIMPVGASIAKENAVKSYGAEVVFHGKTLSDAIKFASSKKGYPFIHPYDDEEIIAGQGTIGIEIMEELPEADCILVPVGGGGLISGIAVMAKSINPKIKVIGIQTEMALSAIESFQKNAPVESRPGPTLADGIAVGKVGEKTIKIINKSVDELFSVSESSIAKAVILLLERKKLVAEGAGAAPLALLLEKSEGFRGKKVVLVLSGGNIDFALIDRIIHGGLVESGRIGVFEVEGDDIPGTLHRITGVIAQKRGNILGVSHDRLARLPLGKARMKFTVETRNSAHIQDIIAAIEKKGFSVKKEM